MMFCVVIFRVFFFFCFVVEGIVCTLVKKRVFLFFVNGVLMYIMCNRFLFVGFSINSGGVIIKFVDFLLFGVIIYD